MAELGDPAVGARNSVDMLEARRIRADDNETRLLEIKRSGGGIDEVGVDKS